MNSSKQGTPPAAPLVEWRDYYIDGGRLVFTADYHRRRGWCCGSGCRHCPYRIELAPSTLQSRVVDRSTHATRGGNS